MDAAPVVKLIRLSACCCLCDDESVKGNNEPSPVCDPGLMLPAAVCVPFSLPSIHVSRQQPPIKQPGWPFFLMQNYWLSSFGDYSLFFASLYMIEVRG